MAPTSTTVTPKKRSPLVSLGAGCIAGGIEACCVWPMEYMKTQLQLQKKIAGIKPPFNGVISGIKYTVTTTGFFSLYRGLAPTLIGSMPKASIRFGANDFIKKLLADEQGKLTPGKNFLAGVGAGTLESIAIVTPLETVKTKLIQNNMAFLPGMKHIFKNEGFAGFYQGLTATVIKQGSNQGLRFMWFNEYKKIVTDDGAKVITPLLSFLGGMSAGCFSTLGNNPFDVLKTRLQGSDAHLYTSTMDCGIKIFKQEGIAGFYRGIIPRLGRVVPGQGIIFMSYEQIATYLEKNVFTN